MSSDESDSEEVRTTPAARLHVPQFTHVIPRWRGGQLTAWLHVFDSVHMIWRRTGGDGLRGAFPRLRISNPQSPRFSNSRIFVPQLPISAYDGNWLDARNDVAFSVRPSQDDYSFTHDDEVFE